MEKDAMKLTAFNVIAAWAGDTNEFTDRFGAVTQENFETWANAVLQFPEVRNSFCNYLINKIGRTYVNAMIAYDPLAFMRGEDLPFGYVIEDMFVEIAQSQQFDPEGKETLNRKLPDVKVLYYAINTDLTYKVSVSDKELRQAFYREGQMSALIERITNSLYQGARHDHFVFIKQLIAGFDGWEYQNIKEFDGTEETAKANGKAMSKAIMFGRFDSKAHNAAGVYNNVPDGEGILLTTVSAQADLDYDYLANVFNLSVAQLKAETVVVDNFNDRTDILAVYMDRRIVQNHFQYDNIEAQRNSEGRFTNYTLVQTAIYSMAKWFVGIAFTTATPLAVKFDANGGTGTMADRTAVNGTPFSTPFNSFKPASGKTFSGWCTAATVDGSHTLLPEVGDINVTAETTLYAIWK